MQAKLLDVRLDVTDLEWAEEVGDQLELLLLEVGGAFHRAMDSPAEAMHQIQARPSRRRACRVMAAARTLACWDNIAAATENMAAHRTDAHKLLGLAS